MAIHLPTKNATFVHIPKNGGTSFETWLKQNNIHYLKNEQHCTLQEATEFFPDTEFSFVFVRNPYARLVSQFHFVGQTSVRKLVNPGHLANMHQKRVEIYNQGFSAWIKSLYNSEVTTYNLDYDGYRRDTPQKYWVNGVIDKIFKLENIEVEFKYLQNFIGCDVELPWVNSSKHKHYREYYTGETKKLADEIVEPDLEFFDYEF